MSSLTASSSANVGLGDLRLAQSSAQRVVMHQQAFDLLVQRIAVIKIGDTDGATGHLVFVGGANSTTRCADLGPDLPPLRVLHQGRGASQG